MKIRLLNLILLSLLMTNFHFYGQEEAQKNFQNKNYIKVDNHWRVLNTPDLQYYQIIDNQITIKFIDGASDVAIQNFIVAQNLTFIRKAATGWYDFQVNQNIDIFQRSTNIVSESIVANLEIPTYGKYEQTSNDTQQSSQWALDRIQAKEAWDIETGEPSVVVAVIDSGTDWTHEDLGLGTDGYQNIYLNPGEDAWSDPNNPQTGNGVDDDNNGLIDDWKGWNFPLNNNNSRPISNPHGTRVAGIVGAKTNNNIGIAGIAGGWNNLGCKMLTINIGDTNPSFISLDDAILYACEKGAKIIQLTVSGASSTAINDAIEYAYDNYEAIIVCSSGNYGVDTVAYPANHPKVLSVGASNQNDQKWIGSCYGENLFIVAPGTSILSTTSLNNTYDYKTGTDRKSVV